MNTETDIVETVRAWAKAYRDTPEHRFPSDPHAEFFPVDLEAICDEVVKLRAGRDAAAQDLRLGDIVEFRNGAPHAAEWHGVVMKIVGIRIDGDGHRWVDVIEPWARPRLHGWYDGETTDIDVDHLCRTTAAFVATDREASNG